MQYNVFKVLKICLAERVLNVNRVLSDKIWFSCNAAIVFSNAIFEINIADSFTKTAFWNLYIGYLP